MNIIPVIDLMQGQVVRARRGERHRYSPIESGLCHGSAPLDVVGALLELYPFDTLYIADLDAIQGHGNHRHVVAELRQHFPQLTFWLDAGLRSPGQSDAGQVLSLDSVIGSENIHTLEQYQAIRSTIPDAQGILSLDYNAQGFQGPASLASSASLWPQRVIAMTLTRVGSHQGPDLATLSALLAQAGDRKLYAAGGIRNVGDLHTLSSLGIAGALVASALHDGHLQRADLTELSHSAGNL